MEGVVRELTATERRRHCFWRATYAQTFPHPTPTETRATRLQKNSSKEKKNHTTPPELLLLI